MWGRVKAFVRSTIMAQKRKSEDEAQQSKSEDEVESGKRFRGEGEPMPPNINPEGRRSVADVVNDVWRVAKLREMILGHVIENEMRRGSSRNDLRSLRLVAKSWLQDANSFLLKSGQPLYRISVNLHNRWNRFHDNLFGDSGNPFDLDKFTSAMISPNRLETELPPFSLQISRYFFSEENFQSFSNFLAGCAPGLVKLEMSFPEDGGSMNFLFPGVDLNFPNLCEFTLSFHEGEEGEFPIGSNPDALSFVQRILTGSEKLKRLRFLEHSGKESKILREMRNLRLPPSITSLDARGIARSSELEALFNLELPHLEDLYLSVSNEPYANGLISRILEKFRRTLRSFEIDDKTEFNRDLFAPRDPPNLVRFPFMEKMESLHFDALLYAELEEDLEERHSSPPQNLFPNLKTLTLGYRRIETIKMWTESLTFLNVTTLHLSIVGSTNELHVLHLGNNFSSLTTLRLDIKGEVGKGDLDQIFLEMSKLNTLRIYFSHENDWYEGNHEDWDAILTGVPDRRPNYEATSENTASIANLEGLEKLELGSDFSHDTKSLISDHVFHLAFLKMPKLKTLDFSGGFKVSAKMAQVWRDRGCVLVE